MGLLWDNARMMLAAQRDGADFGHVAMIGRQQFMLSQAQVNQLVDEFQLNDQLRAFRLGGGEFAEPFFQTFLNAQQVDSLDHSAFEGASILHDLNTPITESLHERFDFVFDGGTLEHLFNAPVAIENYMRMTKVGGKLMIATTANNLCGHGFYQFSPEWFYRVLRPEHGFRLLHAVLVEYLSPAVELIPSTRCFEVRDPDQAGERIGLLSSRPMMLMALAERIGTVPTLTTVTQSDYERRWESATTAEQPSSPNAPTATMSTSRWLRRRIGHWKRRIASSLPNTIQRRWQARQLTRSYSINNQRFFQSWKP